jgi:hypothetical protein
MENLVEAVPTRMNLEGIREKHKDNYGKLTNGNEKGRGRVHRYDISSNLSDLDQFDIGSKQRELTFEPKVRYPNIAITS